MKWSRGAVAALFLLLVAGCGSAGSNDPGRANLSEPAPAGQPAPELPTDDIPRLEVPPEYTKLQPPKPLDDAAFIERGRKLYLGEAGCAMCHGDAGAGDGQMAPQYTEPPVSDLTDPVLHNSMSDQYIYWRLVVIEDSKYAPMSGMTGYAAIAFDEEITEEEAEKAWAVVAFVRSLRKD